MRQTTVVAAVVLGGTLFAISGVLTGQTVKKRTEAAALECARSSDGADQSIVDCYTVRGLAVPDDV